ncbi:hypothetical protein [Metamycoplasma buccale]|uniref:hypothetical protein n=1 Tax=Metamycoplasma buccale TaxID=55602 RepID=UPI00398E5595
MATRKTTIKTKDINAKANKGKKTTGELQRFYISEKWDGKNKDVIYFNFKMANSKNGKRFDEFLDAVKEFITVSQTTNKKTRVWFHRDGAYRGSVDITKAEVIVRQLESTRIDNEKVITYLEENKLVDKPEPKETKTKKEIIEEMPIFANEEFEDKDVMVEVIKPENQEETQFVVVKDPSATTMIQNKQSKDKASVTFWVLISILICLVILNIVLIVLGVTNKI